MPDVKISALPASTTPLAGTEVLPIVQSATTRQVSVANLTAGRAVSALSLTSTNDASISGLTVGKGGGAIVTNTALGLSALNANTTGAGNAAFGYQVCQSNTTGLANTAIGGQYVGVASPCMNNNTTGSFNTALGASALAGNTTASNNTAVGYSAIYTNSTGINNVAVGFEALKLNTTANNNTAVGYQAGISNTTGTANVVLGNQALYSNTTASNNTAVGYQAGYAITTGTNNSCFGAGAGYGSPVGGADLTTGQFNTLIGAVAYTSGATDSSSIVIGFNTAGKGSNTGFINPNSGGVYQGNNSLSWSITSDARLKKNIVDNNTGLDKITAIQVRNFEYRLPEEVTELPTHSTIKKEGVQLGVIAQELQQVLPECVKTESTGVMTVDSDNLTWYMINAIKELQAQINELKGA